jgi:phosphoribosyl 1,2-cyclic phosphodiesterase
MRLRCLGSSSSGNCYLIENEKECLVLEAGISLKEVSIALDFNVLKIVGLLITHEHGDHAKYAEQFYRNGIPIGTSIGTGEAIKLSVGYMKPGYWYTFGNFSVTSFQVIHDAAEPFGFIIRHKDIGTLLFASDTEYIKQNFKKLQLNHIMIECNYSQKIIDGRMHQNETVKGLRDRVMQSHMEFETCKAFIKSNMTSALDTVTLLHLSDGNSNAKLFQEEVQSVVDFMTRVYVADKGVTVDLDIIPFN